MRIFVMLIAGMLNASLGTFAAPSSEVAASENRNEITETSEMSLMARSMAAMADTCKMMMEREMSSRPVKMAALAVLGALGTVALLLFIVLEVQWIRWWNLKIRTQKLLAGLGLKQFRVTLASTVRELAYRLYTVQAQAQAAQEAAERGQELVQVLVQRDPGGINPLLESRLIEASVITLNSRATEALTQATALVGELNQLRGHPLDAPLEIAPSSLEFSPVPPADTLVGLALTNNFDVLAQQLELAQQGLRVDLTRKDRWQPITISPFYSQERAGDRENTVGIGLSIPVPLWNRNTGNIKAAEARQEQAEVAVYLTQRRVERELRERVAAYNARLEQMSRWRPEIVESLRESAALADRHYRLGAVPVATYVELQEKYLEALEAILTTRAEALQQRQEIQLLTGEFAPELIKTSKE